MSKKEKIQPHEMPLISKEAFVDQLNFLKEMRTKFDRLSELMEELSPGFRVDFIPNLSFEDKIIPLLSMLMHEPFGNAFNDNLIEYFVDELDFGASETIKPEFYEHGKKYKIPTPDKLYEALVEINFANKKQQLQQPESSKASSKKEVIK